jgi:hypothetical protein
MTDNINKKLVDLAVKYYGTANLNRLTAYQLDKITTWATSMNPDQGKNQQRKAQNKLRKGKWYKNSNDKTKAILENQHRH